MSNYVRSRNVNNEAAEAPARLLRHRKEKSLRTRLFLRYGYLSERTLEGNFKTLLNEEECRSWFSLIEYETSKACGTQAAEQFLVYVVGKLKKYNLWKWFYVREYYNVSTTINTIRVLGYVNRTPAQQADMPPLH